MAQMMKGSAGMKPVGGPNPQGRPPQGQGQGTGMVVGAVVNKPPGGAGPHHPPGPMPPQGMNMNHPPPNMPIGSLPKGMGQQQSGMGSMGGMGQIPPHAQGQGYPHGMGPPPPTNPNQPPPSSSMHSHVAPPTTTQPTTILARPQPIVAAKENVSSNTNGAGAPPSEQNQQLEGSTTELPLRDMANTKEKTPMCLINELARFNKIQHQYTLNDEQGPAHKKTFFVKLKLGDEEYNESGASIKKAQHAAADLALQKTQYKHPPPKPPREDAIGSEFGSMTPTVELNAMAMKRGEPAVYRPLEMQRPPYYAPPNMDFRGMYNRRYHYPMPRVFYVSLKVGQREFIGEGNTRQSARHNAAEKALGTLRTLPMPNEDVVVAAKPASEGSEQGPEATGEEDKDALKSEISLVHEIALRRNMAVTFEVIKESGPPHMRNFVTRCTCGKFVVEAEGNSKKLSKKRVAEKMLEELRKLTPVPQGVLRPKKMMVSKKKNKNLIKADPGYGQGINPISRLIQIQQAKKEKEPIYTLVTEKGMPRRREFVMQVTVGDVSCTGVGPNKKLAKRSAAEAMLQMLGYSRPTPQPSKPAIKTEATSPGQEKKVSFIDQENTTRQLIPGVILMPDGRHHQHMQGGYGMHGQDGMNRPHPGGPYGAAPMGDMAMQQQTKFSPQTTAAIAKELLDTGVSPTAEAITKAGAANSATVVPPTINSHKQQLLYLSDIVGFKVQFTDFPKGNHKNEYLSLVSLSTLPPQVSHGAGLTIDASHDMAALTALRTLVQQGLLTDIKPEMDPMGAGGDGPHIKSDFSRDSGQLSEDVNLKQ